jgi:hypothetical protein
MPSCKKIGGPTEPSKGTSKKEHSLSKKELPSKYDLMPQNTFEEKHNNGRKRVIVYREKKLKKNSRK